MGDRNLEREPEYNFESAFRPDQFMGSISHVKETKIFTLELPTAIAKSSYRSLVDSSIGQVEPEQIIKNILVQTGIVAPDSEAQTCANKYIDDVSHQYRQYFFDDINGKITKNVDRVEELFEATKTLLETPLLDLAIDIRKSFPKQTNVVEAEHMIRMLILAENNTEK